MPAAPANGKIQVTHLITDLGRGGAETFLRRLVSVPQDDIENRVISLTSEGEVGPEIRAAGVDVNALELTGSTGVPRAVMALIHKLREDRPHVLMTWLYHADFLGTVAATLARSRSRLVWNIRCADMDLAKYGYVSRALPHVLARLSHMPAAVVANSEAGRQVHERFGYEPRRWEILPNGFDTQTFRPNPALGRQARAALGIDPDAPVVGLFARFDPMKDHALFLNAAAAAARVRPDVVFLLAGRGTDGPAFDRLIGGREDLRKHLILLGEREDIPALRAATDIVVCSSQWGEGFPNVIGEAMASGCPCISTDVGAAAVLIGDTGALVPRSDWRALADKIEEFLNITPPARAALGEAARRRIEDNFSLTAVAARYAGLFRELARGP